MKELKRRNPLTVIGKMPSDREDKTHNGQCINMCSRCLLLTFPSTKLAKSLRLIRQN